MANVLIDYFHLHKSCKDILYRAMHVSLIFHTFHCHYSVGVVYQYCPDLSDEEFDEDNYQIEGFVSNMFCLHIDTVLCWPAKKDKDQNSDAIRSQDW